MKRISGWFSNILAMANNSPWGTGSGGSGNGGGNGDNGGEGVKPDGPRNPWQPGGGSGQRPGNIEDMFRRRGRGGGGGGSGGGFSGLPRRPNGKSYVPIIIGIFIALWIVLTVFHRVAPQERGVVSFFGSYSRTVDPGIALTLPAPFESFEHVDVQNIRTEDIPTGDSENLILTGDQNLVDLAYSVRWNIKDPKQFLYQLADPIETIREAAEASMRASIAEVTLDDAIGSGREEVEQRVEQRMQELLDGYRSGIRVQGVAIKKADPPAAVNDAFKAVSAAQQEAQTYLNEARAYAQQLTAQAQGEAAAFDKVYAEYRLAPEVTRRRMYYETMERVLSKIDKTIVEPGGVTPYIALPEVRKRSREAQPSVTVSPAEGQ
ncbi:MAG: FtsH protease activity modulator HflK [Blastomonas sp.]